MQCSNHELTEGEVQFVIPCVLQMCEKRMGRIRVESRFHCKKDHPLHERTHRNICWSTERTIWKIWFLVQFFFHIYV